MENTNDSGKLFGNLALGLLIAGLLIPFIIAMFAGEDLAMGFGIVAVVLALVFGALGWKYKTGRVAVVISAGLVFLSLVTYALFVPKVKAARQKAVREAIQKEAAEQRTERDSQ